MSPDITEGMQPVPWPSKKPARKDKTHGRGPLWSTTTDQAHRKRLVRVAWFEMYRGVLGIEKHKDDFQVAAGANALDRAIKAATTLERLGVPLADDCDEETP